MKNLNLLFVSFIEHTSLYQLKTDAWTRSLYGTPTHIYSDSNYRNCLFSSYFQKSTEVTPSINHRVSRGNVPHGDRSTRVAHKKRVGALKGRNCRCLT
jgi:hypothetical protein